MIDVNAYIAYIHILYAVNQPVEDPMQTMIRKLS